jgi:hypothetical protein
MDIRKLMEVACEKLKAGEEEAALDNINMAWKKSREPESGFPEENLLPYLDTLVEYGHAGLALSILKFALARAELIDDGNFRLNCFCKMLPYLAVHCREKAEEIIDHILALPSGLPGTRDETLHPEQFALIEMALVIGRHDLAWGDERIQHFRRHLEHWQFI